MSNAKRLGLFLFVLVGCVGCDQTTKSIAQTYLPQAEVWSFLGDTVRLQLARNHGGFLSLGVSLPEFTRMWGADESFEATAICVCGLPFSLVVLRSNSVVGGIQ